MVVLFIHVIFWLYEMPLFLFRGIPNTWETHYYMNLIWIASTILWWFMFYMVHFTEPGYLKQNTIEYKNILRKVCKIRQLRILIKFFLKIVCIALIRSHMDLKHFLQPTGIKAYPGCVTHAKR